MYYNNMMIYFLALIILWPTPGHTTPPSSSNADSKELIDHTYLIASEISNLHLSNSCSDVFLVVNGERLPAHRTILALSSEYFRKLFYTDDDETYELDVTYKSDVIIPDVPVHLFKVLLKYMYTRQIKGSLFTRTENLEFLKILEVFDIPNLKLCDDAFKRRYNDEINHTNILIRNISSLLTSKRFSDAGLIVNGNRLPVHRFLLASRSEYFNKAFYGEENNTYKPNVIIPKDVSVKLFEPILNYIYNGQIQPSVFKDKDKFELLKMTKFFGIANLKLKLHKFLQKSINLRNVLSFLTLARLYEYEDLKVKSLNFIDNHSSAVLRETDFVDLPPEVLQEILNRDTFYVNELDIFYAVCRWINKNQHQLDSDTKLKVLSTVRYPLMSVEELSEARESKLVSSDIILAAIQYRYSLSPDKPQCRGVLIPNEYLAYVTLPPNNSTNHCTNMIKLEKPSFINFIEISLYYEIGAEIDDSVIYSYYIEVSTDGHKWKRVINHSNFNCRSYQNLWIDPQIVQYIHIVGTNSTANNRFLFHRVRYDTIDMHNIKIHNGLVVPNDKYNVASELLYPFVTNGQNSVVKKSLLYVYSNDKDRQEIYTYHVLRSGCIEVHLAQPYILSSIRLLLWGGKDQAYSYKIDVSVDGQYWEIIVDKSKELSQSWQELYFKPMPILYIRITGIYSSSGNEFRCVYLETPVQVKLNSNVIQDDRAETNTMGNDDTDIIMTETSGQTPDF